MTQGVSDAELALLIAGLQPSVIAEHDTAPAIELGPVDASYAPRAEAYATCPAHVMAVGGPDHYAAGLAQQLGDAIQRADWASVQRIAADPYLAGEDLDMARGALACAPPPYGPPLPIAKPAPEVGPWFPCQRPGTCSGCGRSFEEFDMIRADGEGAWLASCCSPLADKPADGIMGVAVAAEPAGPPPSTITELRQVLIDYEANRPRSMQKALGPSEIGTPCQQEIARKLAGAPRRPITEPTWAPFQGTAVHASMEDVVGFWNRQLGRERWLAEDRLTVVEGVPAAIENGPDYPSVEGNGDAFDTDWDEVVDWKHVGTTALDKLRAGKRLGKHPAEQVSPTYRVQAHLYGMGHANKGRKVRWVRLVLLARSWRYDDSEEWTEEYREDIALKAIERYWSIVDLLHDLGGTNAGDLITAVPAAPGKDTCKWCPFYRPGVASDWNGCAGDRPPETHLARATAGLIETP